LSVPANALPAPLYAQVKQMIAQQIRSGVWPAHYRVPSEAELVDELGFSRMTINRALRELTAEGLLVRMQGVGTFVAQPKARSALFAVNNIADEIAARNHRHHSRVVRLAEEPAGAEQAQALDIRAGQPVFHSLIVHYEDDVPIQLEDRYVNVRLAPDYLLQDFTQSTPYEYLTRVAPLSAGEHVVEAIVAKPRAMPVVADRPRRTLPADPPAHLVRRPRGDTGPPDPSGFTPPAGRQVHNVTFTAFRTPYL